MAPRLFARQSQLGVPLVITALFQFFVWFLDPFHVHTALNNGKPLGLEERLLLASANCGLWLWVKIALTKPWPLAAATLMPFVFVFTFGQWVFWWWPYLLGEAAGMTPMVEEHKAQLAQLPRWLPAIGDNLIPDIEHTILMPMSMVSAYCASKLFMRVPFSKNLRRVYVVAGLCWASTQLAFILSSPEPTKQMGPILVFLQICVCVSLVGSLAFAVPPPQPLKSKAS